MGATPGSAAAGAVAACLRGLGDASTLPGVGDVMVAVPPVLRAWCRRVGARNLWLLYRFDDVTVTAYALSASPPVPIDEE